MIFLTPRIVNAPKLGRHFSRGTSGDTYHR
jgi:hypothetical protein